MYLAIKKVLRDSGATEEEIQLGLEIVERLLEAQGIDLNDCLQVLTDPEGLKLYTFPIGNLFLTVPFSYDRRVFYYAVPSVTRGDYGRG